MARTSIRNDTQELLCLWLEPWGSDHWMRPGERFTVVASGVAEPVDEPFETVIHDQGISVWVNIANTVEVLDERGREVTCGHQRPMEAIRAWTESARRALDAVADKSPQVQAMAHQHLADMQRALKAAEAREAASTVSARPTASMIQIEDRIAGRSPGYDRDRSGHDTSPSGFADDDSSLVILDKLDFLLKVSQIAVGVDQIEPLLGDLLDRILRAPQCQPVVSRRFEELLRSIDHNKLVIIEYCMHELRWDSIRAVATELQRAAGPDEVIMYHHVLESFQDDWPNKVVYDRFD